MFGLGRIVRRFVKRAIRQRQAGKSGLGGRDESRFDHRSNPDRAADSGTGRLHRVSERQGKMATAKKAAQAKASDREAEDAPKDDEDDDEGVEQRSRATNKPVRGGKDPNQADDDDMTFSVKGNRISVELENDDRAPDTLRSFADLVDGLG
jgi:hypothetical protein